MDPEYIECSNLGAVESMERLGEIESLRCEDITSLNIRGQAITTLEPLRGLRRVGRLSIDNTAITTLEPLRDLEGITVDASFSENAQLGYCEVTGWAADVRKRGATPGFGLDADNPKQSSPCASWPYPAR